MRHLIKAEIQNMARSEALSMIPNDTLERIKRTDKRPEVKIFKIAEEGTAKGTVLNFGMKMQKAINYVKDMIVKIGEKLNLGTGVFHRHGESNDNTGREQIGEVVGKVTKYVGDKLSTLAAIYIYPEYRKLPLDIASFEANVTYVPKTLDKAEAVDVDDISGIALSNSAIDSPAFAGATLMGVVQCFMQPETKEEKLIAKIKGIRQKLK